MESRLRCRLLQVGCLRATTSTYRRAMATTTMGNYLGKKSRSLRRHERRPSHTHTAAPVLGPRAVAPGVAANTGPSVDVSPTASCAAPTGRVPGLIGALSSSPVHRALVLVLGTNIAVLLDCSKSSRQCSLPYLLYLLTHGICTTTTRTVPTGRALRPSCSRYIRARVAGPPEAITEAGGRPRNRPSHPAAQ